MTRKEYIELHGPYIVNALKGKPLFPSVMMAQALIESASKDGVPGGSLLASKYNNHFGIKADASWSGGTAALFTNEYVKGEKISVKQVFRVYKTAQQSFDDRISFLLRNKRYERGGVFHAATPAQQAEVLQMCGYATDPHYSLKLLSMIERLGLTALDE